MRRHLLFEELNLDPFQDLPDEIRSPELFISSEWVNHMVDAASYEVIQQLGFGIDELKKYQSIESETERQDFVERLADTAGVVPDRVEVFAWLFRWLIDPQRVVGVEVQSFDDPMNGFPSFEETFLKAIEADPQVQPNAELIQFALAGYRDFLVGEVEGDQVLFKPGSFSLWESYFSNSHRITRSLNSIGAHVVKSCLEGKSEVRILELGGGLGSAAEKIIEEMEPQLSLYHFTDVAAGFLRRGGNMLEDRFTELNLDFSRIDINKPFGEQKVSNEGYDLIYAVNVLHLAKDLKTSLSGIHSLLRDGGQLVFVEGVRPERGRPIAAEFAFHLLLAFRDVEVGTHFRPEKGFLTGEDWSAALKVSGFKNIEIYPEPKSAVEAYPNHYLGAFVAR